MKRLAVAAALVASVFALTGCVPVPASQARALPNAEELPVGIIKDADEVDWYASLVSRAVGEWLSSGVWQDTYRVNPEPLVWISEERQEAFPSPASIQMCNLWTGDMENRTAASITNTFIYRLASDDEVATPADVEKIVDALASGLRRNNWGDATKLSEGQYAWQAPISEDEIPVVPLESTGKVGFETITPDALAYRIQFANRGDGYVSFYLTSPCALITPAQLDNLRDAKASDEIDIIVSDRDKSVLVNPQG